MNTTDPYTPEHLQGLDAPVTALLGSTEASKRALARFEAQLPELHAQLSNATGWCEVFFMPKRTFTPSMHAFLTALARQDEQQQPIPASVAQTLPAEVVSLLLQGVAPTNLPHQYHEVVFQAVKLEPSVRSRWREDAHISTISLGLLHDAPPSLSPLLASHRCASMREETRMGSDAHLKTDLPPYFSSFPLRSNTKRVVT